MAATRIRKRGRPRVHDTGATRTSTQLAPKILRAVQQLATNERRSLALMLSVLVEEALRARGEIQ